MRRGLLAFGLLLLFLGVVFMSVSRVVVKPEIQTWATVEEVKPEEPTRTLFLEGHLTQGDRFRIYFLLDPASASAGRFSLDAAVRVNLTDPQGHFKSYDIPIERRGGGTALVPMAPLPRGDANYTGTYEVSAEAIWGLMLTRLALQRIEIVERDPEYPYVVFLPVGGVVLLGGVGVSFLGVKSSRRRRAPYKRRLSKRKG